MGSDTWSLAHNGDVEMRDAPAACAYPLDRETEETIRGCATPLRIARRKVNPDVPLRKRSENGIDNGVQHNIGV